MRKKLIKNSQPFGKKSQKSAGGIFWLTVLLNVFSIDTLHVGSLPRIHRLCQMRHASQQMLVLQSCLTLNTATDHPVLYISVHKIFKIYENDGINHINHSETVCLYDVAFQPLQLIVVGRFWNTV